MNFKKGIPFYISVTASYFSPYKSLTDRAIIETGKKLSNERAGRDLKEKIRPHKNDRRILLIAALTFLNRPGLTISRRRLQVTAECVLFASFL